MKKIIKIFVTFLFVIGLSLVFLFWKPDQNNSDNELIINEGSGKITEVQNSNNESSGKSEPEKKSLTSQSWLRPVEVPARSISFFGFNF